MSFVQLQVMSSYSLLQSTISIEELVIKAKERGYQAIALTDHNILYGLVDFYKMCKKHQIKPILGLTLDVGGIVKSEENHSIILLAKNAKGYENLMILSSKKMLLAENERLTVDQIEQYSQDLIAITPGETGEAESFLFKDDAESAATVIKKWQKTFPKNQFYIGVQLHLKLKSIKNKLNEVSRDTGTPTVALQDIRYIDADDEFSTAALRAIDKGETLSIQNASINGDYFLPESSLVEKQFKENDLAEEAQRTNAIADMITSEIVLHQQLLPKFPLPTEKSTTAFLKEQCLIGLEKRVSEPDKRYIDRLEYELTVIGKMGFEDYFLIVWDVMAYAHKVKIVTGAGRGSAAGSLVAYLLGITDVDPIEYDLLFERFLNEERYTMPDIDLDFPDNRREEILQYVRNKYGKNHVAQIATFGTLAAKMALKDVSRVFGLSPSEANVWSKAIPSVLGITLEKAFKQSATLRKLVEENEKNTLLFETAKKIEGLPRHISTHAAGVVISDKPLTQYVPLQKGGGEIFLTQYPMGNVEEIGLLKMDFLGLKNLSIIDNALKLVQRETGKRLNLLNIPMQDQETLQLFRKGDMVGIFQFESAGIKSVLRRLEPSSMEDIAAVNALYRPGPMEQIDTFIKRKKGVLPIVYPHESLSEILSVTYGVMVYQEQVMQVAARMGGYTLGQADILRRAIGKKQKSIIDKERQHFTSGAAKLGYTPEVAMQVYDYIERFANYGFNRSHAVAYSFIAYQMAYLKAHYPNAFFVALLNSALNNSTKMKEYIIEAKKRAIKVLSPDINASFGGFSLINSQILFGFSSIKGLRRDMIDDMITNRKNDGKYKDLIDFLKRLDKKWLKPEYIKPLIYVGAFDQFEHSRGTLLASIEGIIQSVQMSGNNIDLFELLKPKYESAPDLTIEEKLENEENFLGTYLSGHPTEKYDSVRPWKQIVYINELTIGKTSRVLGSIKNIHKITTKKGEPMAFVTISDTSGDCSLTLFPTKYRQFIELLTDKTVLYVEGKVESKREGIPQIIVNQMDDVEKITGSQTDKKCFIRIQEEQNNNETLEKMKNVMMRSKGNIPVVLYYVQSNKKIGLAEESWINDTPELIEELENLLGKENIVIKNN
ncbi:DNA polymerase III subunit alpha [Carnobacterium inhibens]|uniref:DNA polymerase III subunit alpha n=2 Tax=Carnobacterium inhibens TaxID=147709 RepID=U5S8H0_9LACT|nr:DNA polymerase III subunit alpha [Carnobacterium inhibens]AGY81564.1 DNA polymerase III subunit epsilon [Carnobacterium inhibens subsp. gilichinskyi]MBC9824714.1 DNA polymerase III subunit alpha [Carnobacterium inhibens]